MKNVTVYVGYNVHDLTFTHGGGEPRIEGGVVYINAVADTSRMCPYSELHDSSLCENLAKDMRLCLPVWNMHISTQRRCVLNLLGDLVDNGILAHDSIRIVLLDKFNNKISESSYTEDGYLSEGWYAGFMDASGNEWKEMKK